MQKIGEKTLAKEATNCIENLLIREEISIDNYEILTRVVELLILNNDRFELGDGIMLQLVDCKKA